jgi:hypothetical protein
MLDPHAQSGPVMTWWTLLSAIALLNVAGWVISAGVLRRRVPGFEPAIARTRHQLLWLGAGYVLGCAFRSFLPMIDAARICLHDTPISRIVIGRSAATIAELCFASQFALLLAETARSTGHGVTRFVARVLFPLTVVAELFSWSAVLTTNYLFHAIENSLWTVGASAVVAGFACVWSRVDERSRRFIVAVLICGGVYLAFMTLVDVPMYVSRWQATLASGAATLSASAGLAEIVARCSVVRDWDTWREEIPWLSLYFSTAVWISILLAHAPPLGDRRRGALTGTALEPRAPEPLTARRGH